MGDVGSRVAEDLNAAIGSVHFDRVALERLSEAIGVERSVWISHVPGRGAFTRLAPFLTATQLEEYEQEFAHLNPFVGITPTIPPGVTIQTSRVINMRAYRRSPYFSWADRTIGAYELGVVVSRHDGGMLIVSFGRHRARGDFAASQVQRLRALVPSLRRAHFLHTRLDANAGMALRTLLAHVESSQACFALSAQGRVLEANAAGDLELQRNAELSVGDQRLRFRVPAIDRAFVRALQGGLETVVLPLRPGAASGDALLVRTYGLGLADASQATRWLLFVPISQPAKLDMRVADCAERWALTALERRVLEQLALGSDLAEIARAQRHTLETTRTVLKNLFRKSGTRRQAELVACVLG